MIFSILVAMVFFITVVATKRVYNLHSESYDPWMENGWMKGAMEYRWVRHAWERYGNIIIKDLKTKPRDRYFTPAKLKKVAA